MQARFITVEGGEGAGKSVFTRGLSQALQATGIPLVLTREPGGTPLADQIRQLFLHPPAQDIPTPLAALLLVSAARAQHIATRIRPLLADHKWVLCDRFYDSTRVYQGALAGIEASLLEQIIAVSVGDCHPHLTFILDCPVALAMQRIELREQAEGRAQELLNRYDGGSVELHAQLRQAYQQLSQRYAERIVMINAEESPAAMVQQAMRHIQQRWSS